MALVRLGADCLEVNFGQVLMNMRQLSADEPSASHCQSISKDLRTRPSPRSPRRWSLANLICTWIFLLVLAALYVYTSVPLQHISSRRHKDRAAGKPAKPKFSPYTLSQRHHSFQSVSTWLSRVSYRCVCLRELSPKWKLVSSSSSWGGRNLCLRC